MELVEDKIFNNDVQYMRSLVGREVSVKTVDGLKHNGIVYVVDPVYKTVVLTAENATGNFELIMHHALRSLEVVSDRVHEEFLHSDMRQITNDEHLKNVERKNQLMRLLRERKIQVEEKGENLILAQHVKMEPPYGVENCYCDNTIVLERMREVLNQLL